MGEIESVLAFWFEENDRSRWFVRDDAFDAAIRRRFSNLHRAAAAGARDHWRKTARGCLAEVIVLDQFSRNLYRDDPRAFAGDPQARVAALHAIDQGFDRGFSPEERVFLYLPFEHSEEPADQERSIALFSQLGGDWLVWAEKHKAVIDRFGRYPHRNAVLGRQSTPEAAAFLKEPGSSF